MDKEYKSYAGIYWKLWFIFIIVFLVGNIFKIYLLRDIPFDISFFGIFIILGVINAVECMKLEKYLEKNHYEKWKELSTSGKRSREFLSSKDTLNDPMVAYLKSECNKIWLLVIVHFITIAILFVGLNFLSTTGFNARPKYLFM